MPHTHTRDCVEGTHLLLQIPALLLQGGILVFAIAHIRLQATVPFLRRGELVVQAADRVQLPRAHRLQRRYLRLQCHTLLILRLHRAERTGWGGQRA